MKRALVVEDDPDIVELIDHYLRAEGFEVEKAADGRRALERLRAESFGLLILDLQLPGLDGLTVCAELRRDKRTSALPIVMLTARGDEADRVVGLEVGADDYVVKPFSPRSWWRACARCCGGPSATRTRSRTRSSSARSRSTAPGTPPGSPASPCT
jgi:DNA-binding response OmpR family regulator